MAEAPGAYKNYLTPNSHSAHLNSGPTFGRRYAIFYNQVRLGTLEVYGLVDYRPETRRVYTQLELDWVRLLPFSIIRDFLVDIAQHVTCDDKIGRESSQSSRAIDLALTEVLWEAQRISVYDLGQNYGQLELHLAGSAAWYFELAALRERRVTA